MGGGRFITDVVRFGLSITWVVPIPFMDAFETRAAGDFSAEGMFSGPIDEDLPTTAIGLEEEGLSDTVFGSSVGGLSVDIGGAFTFDDDVVRLGA